MTRGIALATRLALAFTLACSLARPVHAQNAGIIEGTVADESGAVLPGATVTLKNTETGFERTGVTDAEGCIDKLHDPPRSRGYVFESTVTLKPNFQKTRAFYGCFDWHSSVNSTWTLVKILRTHPDLPVARLIREKLKLRGHALDRDLYRGLLDQSAAPFDRDHAAASLSAFAVEERKGREDRKG